MSNSLLRPNITAENMKTLRLTKSELFYIISKITHSAIWRTIIKLRSNLWTAKLSVLKIILKSLCTSLYGKTSGPNSEPTWFYFVHSFNQFKYLVAQENIRNNKGELRVREDFFLMYQKKSLKFNMAVWLFTIHLNILIYLFGAHGYLYNVP